MKGYIRGYKNLRSNTVTMRQKVKEREKIMKRWKNPIGL